MQKMEAVTVGNLDIVVKKLENMQNLDYKPVLSKSARIVKKTAKKIAPYDTGNLSVGYRDWETDRKSTRLNSSHSAKSRMPSSA